MNPTTRMFSRRMGEQRPCDAQSAIALHRYTPPLSQRLFFAFLRWGWVAVLATVLLTGCDDLQAAHAQAVDQVAAQKDRDALARRLRSAQKVCGPMATAVWLDDRTIYCARHLEASR